MAQAWGDGGHRIICQIAFERLTPEGRTLVDNIMADLRRGWLAEESFAHARTRAYVQANGSPAVQGTQLSDDYFDLAKPIAVERLKQAGVRLAHLINSAAGTLPANMLALNTP